jgi:AAHS family 4-hydroxybenzoate transporter-like MFS transporter
MMVGGAVAGVAGDRFGRRVALIGSVLLFGAATLAASMVNGLLALGVLRFLVGVGLQGATTNATALVAEYAPLRRRAFAITATIVCIPLGAMLAGLIAVPLLPAVGWRGFFIAGGGVSLVVGLMLFRLLPESPRFLARHADRWGELRRVLARIGHPVPPDASFVDRAEARAERAPLKAVFQYPIDTIALWGAFLFCLLAVYSGFNWIPSMLSGAGFDSTVSSTGTTAYNLGGVIGALTGAMAITRFGSKRTMLTMAIGAAVVALVIGRMTITAATPLLPIMLMLGLLGALINAVQVTMYALAAHMYPSFIRATGVGTATSVGRIGAISSSWAGTWALEIGGPDAFFLLIAAAMGAVFLSLAVIRRHIPGGLS